MLLQLLTPRKEIDVVPLTSKNVQKVRFVCLEKYGPEELPTLTGSGIGADLTESEDGLVPVSGRLTGGENVQEAGRLPLLEDWLQGVCGDPPAPHPRRGCTQPRVG